MKQLILITLMSLAAVAHGAGDPAVGQSKTGLCAGCHGADGNSGNPIWPKLAGQHGSYLVKQLKDFKDGRRQDPMMAPMAAALADEDMEHLAAFYASQNVQLGTAAKDQLQRGEEIYRAGNRASGVSACMACHGPAGKGNPLAKFPSLSGQHAAYIVKALNDFASGARGYDAGSRMMAGVASKMTQAEMEAVAQYVQGLH